MTTPEFRLRKNLAFVLKERNITAAQLSRTSGIAKQVLSDWLAGVQPRKLEQLYMASQILNVSLEKLCFAKTTQELLAPEKDAMPMKESLHVDFDEIHGRFEVHLKRITEE